MFGGSKAFMGCTCVGYVRIHIDGNGSREDKSGAVRLERSDRLLDHI